MVALKSRVLRRKSAAGELNRVSEDTRSSGSMDWILTEAAVVLAEAGRDRCWLKWCWSGAG